MLHRSSSLFVENIRKIERVIANDIDLIVFPNMENLTSGEHLFSHVTIFNLNERVPLLHEDGFSPFLPGGENIHRANV
jgi:hypothetical protein